MRAYNFLQIFLQRCQPQFFHISPLDLRHQILVRVKTKVREINITLDVEAESQIFTLFFLIFQISVLSGQDIGFIILIYQTPGPNLWCQDPLVTVLGCLLVRRLEEKANALPNVKRFFF
jgi:hypothetical protein